MNYPGFTIIYKMYKMSGIFGECVVDLELAGHGDDVEGLREQYAWALCDTEISLEKTGKSTAFRLKVPQIIPPDINEENIRKALNSASYLLEWWRRVNIT